MKNSPKTNVANPAIMQIMPQMKPVLRRASLSIVQIVVYRAKLIKNIDVNTLSVC